MICLITNPEKEYRHWLEKCYIAGRVCYSKKKVNELYCEATTKENKELEEFLDKKIFSKGHLSVMEHVHLTFVMEDVSRAMANQLIRHRHLSYCVAGDTIIKQKGKKSRTIKELFESKKQYNDMRMIRCFDENNLELKYGKIKEIIYSGKKDVYLLETNFGYRIKSTLEHRFFTQNGWKKLSELKEGDIIYVNGIEAYKDKNWLYKQYIILNKKQEEIGKECGVSKHTIRKWIRYYTLQKEIGSWSVGVEPSNKGKNKFNYKPMLILSNKMKGRKPKTIKYGEEHHSWKGDTITLNSGYTRTRRNNKKNGFCSNCKKECKTELHHIDKNPKNYDKSNIMELCNMCHKAIHKKEIKEVAIPNKIVSIKYVGVEDTYDICMKGENHNYIANGFLVHNSQKSQRYCKLDDKEFLVIPESMKENKNVEMISNDLKEYILNTKQNLVDLGFKEEDIRFIYPNGTKTTIVVSANMRALIEVMNKRLCSRAQQEIREEFYELKKQLENYLPKGNIFTKYMVPKCKFCTEKEDCELKNS